MSKNSGDRQEIDQHEQWLDAALPPEDAGPTGYLKIRVDIEANEQWLRTELDDRETIAPGLHAMVAQAVTRRGSATGRRRRMRTFAGAAIGLAAMLVAAVIWNPARETAVSATDAEIDVVMDEPEDSAFDEELDEALTEIDELLASVDDSEWDDELDGL